MNLVEEKNKARDFAKKRRASLDSFTRFEMSKLICANLAKLPEITNSPMLAGFWPFKDEVDIRHFIINSMSSGRSLVLPRVVAKGQALCFHNMLRNDFRLTTGYSGIMEPSIDISSCELANIPVMLVPTISADKFGKRIGSGAGFYDITLSSMNKTTLIAPIFSCQLVDKLPSEEHDIKVDIIVTEKEIIDTRT